MILEYHRPTRLEEALELLERTSPVTIPLGGGTFLSQHAPENVAVVDLQEVGLNRIEIEGNQVRIGAAANLQQLVDHPDLPTALIDAIRLEATLNTRNSATLAGRLVTCDGASPLATAFLAVDARLTWLPGNQQVALGDWLPLRESLRPGRLITQVVFPKATTVRFASVGRTPLDRPWVCAAVALWPSGRTRVALGGSGSAPLLAMDGTDRSGAESAAENAYSHVSNQFASSLYIKETAKQLVRRLLQEDLS
jgi:CO/xanthine dehydrogenase FAD-binding subunit